MGPAILAGAADGSRRAVLALTEHGYRVWQGGPVPPGAAAICFGSTIIVRTGVALDGHLLRHELVHLEQWRRLGRVGFLRRYVVDYLRLRLRGWPHWAAYRRLPQEVEAEWRARVGPPAAVTEAARR